MSPDGSWGNMAELAWFDENGEKLSRKGIANAEAGQDAIERAYDDNLLSNFEINQPDGNWIGMDMGKPTIVSSVMVVPRSDDNDVFPGNEYELLGKKTILANPPMDSGSTRYELIRIISQRKIE